MAATVLLAVRSAGARCGARRHRVSLGLHHLDEPERMEGRRTDHFRRTRQLLAAAERPALRRGGRAYAGLYRAVGRASARVRYARGGRVSSELSAARIAARP